MRVDEAIAYDRETRELELRFQGQGSKAQHAPEAHTTDNQIDYTISAIDDSLAHDMRVFGADSPRHLAAHRLRKTLLPAGANAVTSLDYYNELETVGTLLRLTTAPTVAADIATTKLDSHFERLTELHGIFRTQVGVGQKGVVSYEQVTKRRKVGHRNLGKIVAWVLGHYLDDTPAHVTARERLLGPILDQNLKLRRLYARGKMTDIDPNTGEEIDPVLTDS